MPKTKRKSKIWKLTKPSLKDRLQSSFEAGVQHQRFNEAADLRKRINSVADRRRLAFQDCVGSFQSAMATSFKKLVETLDKLDREVNP